MKSATFKEPSSFVAMGDGSFQNCGLESLTLPSSVTKIGQSAFNNCDKLVSINLPATTTNVNPRAFQFCTSLTSINVDDANTKYSSVTTTDHTYVLPRKVEKGGKTYKVALVGDYLFQNASNKVKEVVVFDNVRYIGSRAFMTGTDLTQDASTVENLFFIESAPTDQMLSTTRFRLRPSDLGGSTSNLYNEIASTTNVYVKKSALATYQAQWKDYASKISYKIPDVKISTKYGTFAREFDTDFSEYKKEKGNSDVAAFVAGSPIKIGGGDYGTSTHHIKMRSIDEKGGVADNYGYIPAGTGVLLKVLDKEAAPADFYYTIGERDNQTYTITDNIMTGVTVNPTTVAASATAPVYVMQGGVFRKAEAPITDFPVHRAYFKVGDLPAGAKVSLVFDDNTTTDIESISTDCQDSGDAYYNLNGQRVENPQHGVYIRNGKKIIIK